MIKTAEILLFKNVKNKYYLTLKNLNQRRKYEKK